jgi:hypothetical protein
MTRHVVFGDVHGRADLLAALFTKLHNRFGRDFTAYCVGDLIDRGPDAHDVLDICVKEGVKSVIGNHEIWLHKYLRMGIFDPYALHRSMGGTATLTSYGLISSDPESFVVQIEEQLRGNIPPSHRDYILNMPVWLTFQSGGKQYRICHSALKAVDAEGFLSGVDRRVGRGVEPSLRADVLCNLITVQNPSTVIWTPTNFQDPGIYKFPDGSIQIFGHTPIREATVTRHWIALNTGCGVCPPHALSAVILPEQEIIRVTSFSTAEADADGHHDLGLNSPE